MTPNLDETLAPPMIAVTGDLGPSIAFLIEGSNDFINLVIFVALGIMVVF